MSSSSSSLTLEEAEALVGERALAGVLVAWWEEEEGLTGRMVMLCVWVWVEGEESVCLVFSPYR